MSYPVIKPSVVLLMTWGSEEFTAAMSDVVYRAYTVEKALDRVRNDPGIVRT